MDRPPSLPLGKYSKLSPNGLASQGLINEPTAQTAVTKLQIPKLLAETTLPPGLKDTKCHNLPLIKENTSITCNMVKSIQKHAHLYKQHRDPKKKYIE